MLRLPLFVKRIYAWYIRHIRGDEIYAGLVETCHQKDVVEYFGLIAQREGYRERWFDFMNDEKLDFVLTVPNALPAVPHDGMTEGFKTCGYTFLFNLVSHNCNTDTSLG